MTAHTDALDAFTFNPPRFPSVRRLRGIGFADGKCAASGRSCTKCAARRSRNEVINNRFRCRFAFPVHRQSGRQRRISALVSQWPLPLGAEPGRKSARGKLLELLHYSPPKCDPRPETVERVDCGEYVREKVWFNTTPDLRVPAFVLVPKHAPKPAPAIVALHDHGGFYLWGKEKIVEMPDEHPVLTEFKRTYYGGAQHRQRTRQAGIYRRGYRHVLLGRAADAPQRRPRRLANAALEHYSRAHSGFQLPRGTERATRRAHDLFARVSPGRA